MPFSSTVHSSLFQVPALTSHARVLTVLAANPLFFFFFSLFLPRKGSIWSWKASFTAHAPLMVPSPRLRFSLVTIREENQHVPGQQNPHSVDLFSQCNNHHWLHAAVRELPARVGEPESVPLSLIERFGEWGVTWRGGGGGGRGLECLSLVYHCSSGKSITRDLPFSWRSVQHT